MYFSYFDMAPVIVVFTRETRKHDNNRGDIKVRKVHKTRELH